MAMPRRILWTGTLLWLGAALAACGQGGAEGRPWAYRLSHVQGTLTPPRPLDALLVVDNSPAMEAFQPLLASSLARLRHNLMTHSWPCAPLRVGVLTTGVPSEGCAGAAGEDGRLQDLVGLLRFEGGHALVEQAADPACRVVGPENLDCLADPPRASGTFVVGFSGCGYPRGLLALRRFLGGPEAQAFLRPEADLLVVLVSASEDCGEPGEIAEELGLDARLCSYAALGRGPDGGAHHPDDPLARPYALGPVSAVRDALRAAKGEGRAVLFLAVVGVADPWDPQATRIEFEGTEPGAAVRPACSIQGCLDCGALPGTRAIALAGLSGDGFYGGVASVCEPDWVDALWSETWSFGAFLLSEPVLDPALLSFRLGGREVPRHSCAAEGELVACRGPGDPACACVPSYRYEPPTDPPDPSSRGGELWLADHFDPLAQCSLFEDGRLQVEITYVTP